MKWKSKDRMHEPHFSALHPFHLLRVEFNEIFHGSANGWVKLTKWFQNVDRLQHFSQKESLAEQQRKPVSNYCEMFAMDHCLFDLHWISFRFSFYSSQNQTLWCDKLISMGKCKTRPNKANQDHNLCVHVQVPKNVHPANVVTSAFTLRNLFLKC